jgi:prevent-host-death family protein
MTDSSTELPVSVARERFADIVNNAAYRDEITYVTRHGKRVAAIVPIADVPGRVAKRGSGAALKELLARHEPDPTWGADLAELRATIDAADQGKSPWDED